MARTPEQKGQIYEKGHIPETPAIVKGLTKQEEFEKVFPNAEVSAQMAKTGTRQEEAETRNQEEPDEEFRKAA